MTTSALLAISHGTASPEGQAAIQRLVDAVAERLPGVTVRLGHVDVQQPDVAASLGALPAEEPVVIVPLLLSAGYHVRVDLRKQSAGRGGVAIASALGPDSRLVDVLVERLDAAGLGEADAVVLAVAGSSDDRANEDCREMGRMLAERLSRDVTVGFLAAAAPRLGVAVAHRLGSPALEWPSRTTCSPRGTSTTSRFASPTVRPSHGRCSTTTSRQHPSSTS